MVVPALSTATALLMASWLLLRPVRKMYLFHLSPVMASARRAPPARSFVFLGHGQQAPAPRRWRWGRRRCRLVVGIGGRPAGSCPGQACPGRLSRSPPASCRHLHGAAGGVLQAHHQAGLRLFCRRPPAHRSCCKRGRCGFRPTGPQAGAAMAASAVAAKAVAVTRVRRCMANVSCGYGPPVHSPCQQRPPCPR